MLSVWIRITLAVADVVSLDRDNAISLLDVAVAESISRAPHSSLHHHHSSNICWIWRIFVSSTPESDGCDRPNVSDSFGMRRDGFSVNVLAETSYLLNIICITEKKCHIRCLLRCHPSHRRVALARCGSRNQVLRISAAAPTEQSWRSLPNVNLHRTIPCKKYMFYLVYFHRKSKQFPN